MSVRIAIPIPPEDSYTNYFAAMEALGAEGVKAAADADPTAYDGLLLPGGVDVDTARYHQPVTGANEPDLALDALQFTAVDRFFRAGKPIFGICRGHQLLNVYFGGTLIQDIAQGAAHDWDRDPPGDKVHFAQALEGSWTAALYGTRFPVNSAHHQAVDRLGEGLVVDMWSEDGLVEAMHHESGLVYSVQWHPERMCFVKRREDTVDGAVVLGWFVGLCAARRG